MAANYKNRMSGGLILGLAAGIAACAVICGLAYGLMAESNLKTAVVLISDAGIAAGACLTARCLYLYKAFKYNAKKEVQK